MMIDTIGGKKFGPLVAKWKDVNVILNKIQLFTRWDSLSISIPLSYIMNISEK